MTQTPILEILKNRRSQGKLTSPGPTRAEIDIIIESAIQAPDHKMLSPWRVIAVEENQREKLAILWAEHAEGVSDDVNKLKTLDKLKVLDKLKKKAARAPLILICIASPVENPKVPECEQVITAGIAAYSMLLAANGLGYQGYWRTGALAYDTKVLEALALKGPETIVGYLYIGSGEINTKPRPVLQSSGNKLSYFS